MREASNICNVIKAGADMIGLIFYPKSPRYVQMINSGSGLLPDRASTEYNGIAADSDRPQIVGVFVDDMPQNIITRVVNYNLDYVQLHGNETPELIQNLKATIVPDIRHQLKLIKAISISSATDIAICSKYEGLVDMFLFDTKCDGKGGSGEKFEWSVLDAYHGNTPFLLSGGISPDDIERIKAFRHPQFAGVDINSKFEIEPGLKDVAKVADFIKSIR